MNNVKKFDTKIQHLKYKVLREVARQSWHGTLHENIMDIPKIIVPGKVPTMRCCVYKERAIISERIKIAMGGSKSNPNVIQVLDIACDECPVGGYEVTNACRGCLAQKCKDVCKFGAIYFDNDHTAHIDKSKCKECGACAKVCPYTAIRNFERPCESSCKVKAISMGDEKQAVINNDKCTSCGSCVYMCPFGAITDKSLILNVIDILKKRHISEDINVYAMIAPAIASQFDYARLGQVITGLHKLGFTKVIETALGADMVAKKESAELCEKGTLISSCCPAFVNYVRQEFPQLTKYLSSSLSPMATLAEYLKSTDKNCKIVFIGPCTAKKSEEKSNSIRYVDAVITFEELQALFDSRDIDITTLEDTDIDQASAYGRSFARIGGLSEAMAKGITENGLDFEFAPVICDGIEECRTALLKLSHGKLKGNFIEGMACKGGCIGGAGNLTHDEKNRQYIDEYSSKASSTDISEAVQKFDI